MRQIQGCRRGSPLLPAGVSIHGRSGVASFYSGEVVGLRSCRSPSRGSVRMNARASMDLTSPGPGRRTCGGAGTAVLLTAIERGTVA